MASGLHVTIADLMDALKDVGERYPKLSEDDLFALWFLRAYVTDSEDTAAQAVSGGARDKGIDALLIDDASQAVFVVQAKYRKKLGGTREKRTDVMALAEVAQRLAERDDGEFASFLESTDGYVASMLKRARKQVLRDRYRVRLFFVTLGKVTATVSKDAVSLVRKAPCEATLEVIDGNRAMHLFRDYLDGVAPPIPSLDLEMEKGPKVEVNAISQRYDHQNKIESWVFSMRGDAIASLYASAGLRLFARNIRGFLGGDTPVNEGMAKTLHAEPDRFFYYNNGITVLCDEAVKQSRKGRDLLHVSNPQVINGQQTTRTLAENPTLSQRASVLVKVLVIPRSGASSGDGFEGLVSKVVAGTNWQNAIKPSDLMANDRKQIELERSLRKLGYVYIRKRQKKSEARGLGGKNLHFIDKSEFAQVVAACEVDPLSARTSKEKLFEESSYGQVFPNSDPDFYLPRYWTMRHVRRVAFGNRQHAEAKWLVLNVIWQGLASQLRSANTIRSYRLLSEKRDAALGSLDQAIKQVLTAAMRYFRANRGRGAGALEASAFFKAGHGSSSRFAPVWAVARERLAFDGHMRAVVKAIKA